MILPFKTKWLEHVKQIDIKNCDWPWCDEHWEDVTKYIIKTWWCDGELLGFSAFQFGTENNILISKLVSFDDNGLSALLNNIEEIAIKYNISELGIVIWEHDDFQIKRLLKHGFTSIRIVNSKFPDGSDGYEFRKVINGS